MANSVDAPVSDAPLPEGITKEVLKPASDDCTEKPSTGDECTVHYVGRLKNGDEFDSSEERGEPAVFTLGIGQVIKGWDLAVATMRKGEEARFTIAPEFAYGKNGQPPKIPENAMLTFDVTLVSWKSGADLFGDGGAIRTVLQEGLGLWSPGEEATVIFSWKLSTSDGQVLDDREMVEYVVGCEDLGPLSRTVNKVLPEMRQGTKFLLTCSGDYAFGDGTYIAEIGLKEILQVDDVSPTKDKSIMKKQVVGGKGSRKPEDGDQVKVWIEAAFLSPNESCSGGPAPGFTGRKQLSFKVGDGEVCDALEHAVMGMLPGERAIVICSRPSLCAEEKVGIKEIANLKGEANLMVFLEKFERPKDASDMSWSERVEFATARKEVGGKHFKAQRYGLALQRYVSVVDFIQGCEAPPPDAKELVRLCQLNQAAVLLKLKDPRRAKTACSLVLKDEPKNIKALFRRASACLELDENAEAASDLRELLEVDKGNKEAQRLFVEAVRRYKEEKKKSAQMINKMNKAHDGEFAKEQAERNEIERTTLKPGQVLTIAQQEEAWEKAFEMAKADLEKIEEAREMMQKRRDGAVCESSDTPTLESTDVLTNASGRLHYVPSKRS